MAINRSADTQSNKVRDSYNQNTMAKGMKIPTGIYRGIVVSTEDPRKMGRIKVQIIKFYGTLPVNAAESNSVDADLYLGAMWCRQMLPMGGVSAPSASGQNMYGIMGQPPSVNNEVVVAFSSDSHNGIVLGMLPDDGKISGAGGAGASKLTSAGTFTIAQETAKTATSGAEPPPEHPQAEVLRTQGIDQDRIRGQNFSSPTRDPSNRIMGLTTPIGHAIVMDDGDIEDGDNLGMRFRTAGGAQILMDDTNGLIYVINQNGSSWIEMNRMGDIDIFCGGSFNVTTKGDFNIHSAGKFNVQAGQGINLKSTGDTGIALDAAVGPVNIFANANLNLQAEQNGNIKIAGNYRETAARIDMNGPKAKAAAAARPTVNQLTGNLNITESISSRVPESEPWGGHLDVSVLEAGSVSGSASSESNTYYYGDATNFNTTDSSGTANKQPAWIVSPDSVLLSWLPGKDQRVDPKLIKLAEEVCRQFGRPGTITSGFRSPSHNAKVDGAKRSQHMIGHAIDIVFSGGSLSSTEKNKVIAIASSVGITGIGIYDNSFHFDNRDTTAVGWGADYTSASVPDFAITTMSIHRAGGFT